MIGETMYPITVSCDNKSAIDCTQMDGCNTLKTFDGDVDVIRENLKIREDTGRKVPMSKKW